MAEIETFVDGKKYTVNVDGAGRFGYEGLSALLLSQLKDYIHQQNIRNRVRVRMPFYAHRNGVIMGVIITGVHARNGNLLATWLDGTKEPAGIYTELYDLTELEAAEVKEQYRIAREAQTRAYEILHKKIRKLTDVRKEIQDKQPQ
jgi:hypothetical protein